MGITPSAATWGIVGGLVLVTLAGCNESSPAEAAPLRMHSSQTTITHPSTAPPDLGIDTRRIHGVVTCSVANRFFWFPDTTRSCTGENTKTLTVPAGAVRIDVQVSWDAAQPAARNLTVLVLAQDGAVELDRTSGPSSLRVTVGERLSRTHYANGGVLHVQVDAATGILGAGYDIDVAAAFLQEFTLTVTTTYELSGSGG